MQITKIKYKAIANAYCVTLCPNQEKLNIWQEIKVGSFGCKKCKHFIKDDTKKSQIHCSCK